MFLPIFDPQILQLFITTRTHQIYLRQTTFCSPKFKINLKGLLFADVVEIQETVTEKLKKVQKEEFSADFQKLYDRAKPCYCICQWGLF